MSALLRRSSLRHLARHPGQIGLAVVGVALGVAVVVAVDLANASADRAFSLSSEAVLGRATHQIVGGPQGLPEELLPRIAVSLGLIAAPVVESDVVVPASPGHPLRVLHLLGVDPLSEAPFRGYSGAATTTGPPESAETPGAERLALLLTRPGASLLAAGTAAELGLAPGHRFTLRSGGVLRRGAAELVGLLAPADEGSRGALADLLVMDIASAQELLGRTGRLDRIDLRLPEGAHGQALLARLRAALPPGAQVLPAAARTRTARAMTRAFRINLSALSLLALVCGAFLIYNTISFSVVQRRTLLGILRALGVTRGQVLALVLGEAAMVALAGTTFGLAAGVLLGRGLVSLVSRTINDLYFAVSVRSLALPAATFAKGAALGLGATLVAALAPALEATLAPPRAVLSRSLLEARLRRALPRATGTGVLLLAAGGGLLALPGLIVSFAALFLVILGFALLSPAATVLLMRLLRRPLGAVFGGLGRIAAGGVVASLSRTAVAIAALVVAVSVTVGMGVMIDSFRHTVVRWLQSSLLADIYVGPAERGRGFRANTLDPALARLASRLPGVAAVNTIRRAEIPSPAGPVRLIAVGTGRRGFGAFELRDGDPEAAWHAFDRGGGVLVSEPFSRRTGVGLGSTLRLPTGAGEHAFPVAGVFSDYASDRGLVLMSRSTYLAFWHDPRLSGFSIDLAPGADPEHMVSRLRTELASGSSANTPELSLQSNRTLKRISLEIFDRTFLITNVLRLLASLVAAIGVLSALSALQLERGRELGVLRAIGLTPAEVWRLVTAQTGLLGLAAGLLSLPVGLVLSAIMVYVVNRRSFGWTVRLEVAPQVLGEAMLLAVVTALAAGLYPAWRMARTSPAEALREE